MYLKTFSASLFIAASCLFISVSSQRNSSIYTVVAPSKLRPDIVYHVSITVHDAPAPVDFNVQIFGTNEDRIPVSVVKDVHVDPKQTQIVDFELFDWKPGDYTLEVIGQGGLTVRNSTKLTFEHRSYSVFIQTDRPVYKPGQLVQFRVIVTNPYLLPRSSQLPIDLLVKDGHGNSIREWKNVYTSNGVASADFLLADRPVLGEWAVHVSVEGQKFHKNFTVAEFIMPTYEVHIDLPIYTTYNNSNVEATITAMYSYGKAVKGEVTLTVAPRTRYNKLNVRPYESFQTKAKIDGSVTIYLNLLKDLSLRTDFFKREIEFFALVEEEETGHKYNTTNTMWIYDKDIKIDLIRTSETFKPGLKFTAFLKVSHQDDTPVSNSRGQLELMYGYSIREEEWKTEFYTVPRNGIVKLEFFPPNDENTLFLNMRAIYAGLTFYLDRIDAAVSPTNNFIQAVLITPNPKVGETVEMEVNATEPLNHLVYKVIGRGNILLAKTIPVPNQKTYRFNFKTPSSMAPKGRVLVYYVRSKNNEIVADSVTFDVDGLFKTSITVSPNVREAQPGRQVDIRLQTTPNALIGILGVDLGILKLKSGNDITLGEVIEDLETYDGGQMTKYNPPWYRRRRKRSLSWPGSRSAGLIFADSGSVIMTNALLLNTGDEDLFTENVIRIDENSNNAPIQPPSELPEAVVPEGRLVMRKKYPETWLWINTTAGSDGSAFVSHVVPDSIASYKITAFAVHSTDGLGIATSPSDIAVSRPFFITMALPYTVLMGEDLAIQVVVFNYNNKDIQAEVAMENRKGEFEFTVAGKDSGNLEHQNRRTKIVRIPASDGIPVSFLIVPKKVGFIEIKVTAATSLASDSVTKRLYVQPEGSTQHYNKALFIDLRSSSEVVKHNVSTIIPRNAIRDSGKILLSASVDFMGPSINSIDKLLYMPTGCGEQNLITVVPRIIVMEYLSKTNRLSPAIRNQLIAGLRNGYQRQLTYKREDGSFSTFGERDRSGSTWLTAYATRALSLAKKYIFIDPEVLNKGLEWIIQKQSSDGSFEEPGEVHHKALQGGTENGAALTAFVLMALFESKAQDKYGQQMIIAQRYIERELVSSSSPYVVSIVAYTLHLLDSPSKDRAFQMLLNMAERQDDLMFWDNKEIQANLTDKQSDYWFLAPSIDVETAAYAIRTFALRSDPAGGLPVLKWLISKQNKNGGFSSTQDTVVALHAISEHSLFITPTFSSLDIKFSYPNGQKTMQVTYGKSLNMEEIEISPDVPYVEVEVTGTGIGIVQISRSFNLAVSGEAPQFFLNALLDKTSTASYLQLSICTHSSNIQREPRNDTSNMAVMEVGLPSGYVADVDALPSILQINKVKRVETQLQDTNVVIYFDRLDQEESCVTVPAHRIHKVARQRRVPVKVYDFYSQAKSARMFYRPHKTVLCDICDDDDCGEGCYREETSSEESPLGSVGIANIPNYLLSFILFLTLPWFSVLKVLWQQ
ncbi:CD109 antigen-like isoform X3 [Argiope bruennichi]|nr:CD109 antigen-like isoform X3 [Argiope bruennichi]XP_055932295.1 CD109 antigen-like isoform X3 [Argiope bruennichi]